MRSDTAPARRVRLVTKLSVVSAVMVMAGGILVVASTATRLIGRRPDGRVTLVALGVAGLVVGLVTLLVFAFARPGRTRGSARHRPAGHRHRAAGPAGPGRQRGRALNPTTVYTPGGLIDVPREGRTPGSAGTPGPPGFSGRPGTAGPPGSPGAREAFRAPMAGSGPRGKPSAAQPPSGRTGAAPPRPGYQAGAYPAGGPGWGPPGPPGRPGQRPMPPPGRMRPGDAVPPRDAFPPRDAVPSREAPAARHAFPSREDPPSRQGPPRHGNPNPSRPAGPGPFGPGPGSATARPSAAPGYGTSPGRRPAPPAASAPRTPGGPGAPGAPGVPGPVGPGAAFDGGYAQVIRPADRPVPPARRVQPNPGRPAAPAHPPSSAPPAAPDVYVYRDASDPAPSSPARPPAADDAAYWYDLLAEDPVPHREEARGPFEPLLPSSAPPGQQPPPGPAQRPPGAARDESAEAPERARARKLEQLKDLYLTAEAIGEQNVDKHFDQLLAQQRELISDYFRQSAAAQPGPDGPRTGQAAEAGPEYQQADGQATPPEGVSVRAEPPRAW